MKYHQALFLLSAIFCCLSGCNGPAADRLEEGFLHPADSTRPWVYWYWIDENISKEGITRDLEAMARVGIGEALIGHVSPGAERGEVHMLSDAWWAMVEHAVSEGQRLGVDIGFFNSPGWSQSGGPWIDADQAMRYVVHREMRVRGPSVFSGDLPRPEGEFRDLALLAMPIGSDAEKSIRARWRPGRSDLPGTGFDRLFDGDTATACVFPSAGNAPAAWETDMVLEGVSRVQGIVLYPIARPFSVRVEVLASADGREYRHLRHAHFHRHRSMWSLGPMTWAPLTIALPATEFRYFRLVFSDLRADGEAGFREIAFSGSPVVEYHAEKQLGKMHPEPMPGWDAYLWPGQPAAAGLVQPEEMLDISERLDSAGRLHWDVPEGEWLILRLGTLPTGAVNVPVPPEATGYEVDKMSRAGSLHHFNSYIGAFMDRVPAERRRALKHVVIDSYEVGPQNWTPGLEQVFMERLGYNPIPWLPVLSGRVVGDADRSNRFLWDLRRLVADLIAENYLAGFREAANERGLKLWMENYGHWGFPAEFLQYGGQADMISGEFWYLNHLWDLGSIELRGASSASHIYGKPVTSAEAFTAGFNFRQSPASMKSRGDWAFTEGINHFVLHLYIHQPWEDRLPGVTAWFGMSFQRHNTWFEKGRAWIDYLRRCHYMLQQGSPRADLLYFIGEDVPRMTGALEPPVPGGYDFDFINAGVILDRLSVADGFLTLPEGQSYRALVLPPLTTMRPELLEKIGRLVQEGAVIVGPAPLRSPGLANFPHADEAVRQLAGKIWGPCDGVAVTEHPYGQGSVFQGLPLDEVLEKIGEIPDLVCDAPSLEWTHRGAEDLDIYFLSNQSDTAIFTEIGFRVGDRMPEFWCPRTGSIRRAGRFRTANNYTHVPVALGPHGSVFVVFRSPARGDQVLVCVGADGTGQTGYMEPEPGSGWCYAEDGHPAICVWEEVNWKVTQANGRESIVQSGPIPAPIRLLDGWVVHFPPGWDCPDSLALDRLMDLRDLPEEGMRHFSGTAVYRTSLKVPDDRKVDGDRFVLDLGRVETIAEVKVNGQPLGVIWCPPYEADITGALRAGENDLEIAVTNLWWNRLVGDAKYPGGFPDGKGGFTGRPSGTFATHQAWTAVDSLLPSGLIGPAQVRSERLLTVREKER
jgi:hypothetical protein